MLYDPKWGAKTDQFTLENLIAWLEKQPADENYDYTDMERCLLGQWVQSIDAGATSSSNGNSFAYRCNGREVELSHFREIARGSSPLSRENHRRTFGAALQRARDIAASR